MHDSATSIRIGITFVLLCLSAGGCAGRAASPFAGLPPERARLLAREQSAARDQVLQDDLRSAFTQRTPHDVLVLSGGGPSGAFGAGVLAGWREAPRGRPTFDVVTGVSTGALMATFAFLGEPRDDAALRQAYTRIRDGDVFDGLFEPGQPDSVFDTGPLRRLIARHVTRDVIERVAAAHRSGRRLYVATADLDAGCVVIWPMSRLAADEAMPLDRRLERFRRILLAAAAVPVLFPPVEIDGDLHVDAGVREQVFLRKAMLGIGSAYDAAVVAPPPLPAQAGDRSAHVLTVWAIVNGQLRSAAPQVVQDDLLHIGVRALSLYNDSLQLFNVREIAHLAALHDPAFRFRYAAIPDDEDNPAAPGLLKPVFDPQAMGAIYCAGQWVGRDPERQWHDGAPPLDDDPRATALVGR